MPDFLFSAEWWVEVLAGIILATNIVMIIMKTITLISDSKKTDKDLAAPGVRNSLNKSELSCEHERILYGQSELSKDLAQVQNAVLYLKGECIKEQARREAAEDQPLESQKVQQCLNSTLSVLGIQMDRRFAAEEKLSAATKELAQLRVENAALRNKLGQGAERSS
ncbi:MAG: hypothetical protein VB096_04890 [Pseudoflavonifractor sp.]|nr:hypothetical protein [Pseudoflavonifractor sp.]